jgi:Ca-dependent carbohydrate-binding module xylan-binding
MQKLKTWLSMLGLALGLVACGGSSQNTPTQDASPVREQTQLATPFTGRLLAIGQDVDSIANYVSGMGSAQTPGAVVGYIDIDLNGLSNWADNGAGRNNIGELARVYPNSALVVAVYAVDKLDAINNGLYDNQINTLITTLKSYNRPVYLRFGYEFDGPWNHYDATAYKAAFTRIKNRVNALAADGQISMVWQSSTYCEGGVVTTSGGRPFGDWYPGDAMVDVVAVSYFTPSAISAGKGGTCNTANVALDALAGFARSHNKPLMIAESTPQGFATEARTWHSNVFSNNTNAGPVTDAQIATWYNDYFAWINQNDVRIVTYINANWNAQALWSSGGQGYWGDSRVEANPAIKTLWTSAVANFMKANTPNLFRTLGFGTGGPTPTPTATPTAIPTPTATPTATPTPTPTATPNNGLNKTVIIRARGTSGQEQMTLRVGGQVVDTWTLGTAMADRQLQTQRTGVVSLAFTNDAAGRDVQVDYISVDGAVRQAEDQTVNTGVYQNGACGGGAGRSEWMHCNGAIEFGDIANPVVSTNIRARGTSGQEQIQLRVGGQNLNYWTLTTQMGDTTINTTLSGEVSVVYLNDAAGRDVQVDYISVNGVVRQAEDQTVNTGVYQNGACGGGAGRSEWLHCNGAISFGNF